MTWRLLFGQHPSHGMGGFVSKPGISVLTASKFDFMFSTFYENMQIVASGAIVLDGDYESSSPYTVFGWGVNLGYLPLIMVSCPEYEVQIEYISNTSAQARRAQNTGSGNFNKDDQVMSYIVLKMRLP